MHILAPYLEVQLWPAKQPSAHVMYIYRVCPQGHVTTGWTVHLRLALVEALYELPASASMYAPLHSSSTAVVDGRQGHKLSFSSQARLTLQNMLCPSNPVAPSTCPITCSSAICVSADATATTCKELLSTHAAVTEHGLGYEHVAGSTEARVG